ncbi:MAG: OmpA family protein [Propionicimonas sp.]
MNRLLIGSAATVLAWALVVPAAVAEPTASPSSSTPEPVVADFPDFKPAVWPVQPIIGTRQEMRFVTSDIEGFSTRDGDDFVLLADVAFAYNSADLTSKARTELDRVAQALTESGVTRLSVVGHTDATGTSSHNQRLSERRAKSVASYLHDRLGDQVRISAVGKGESQPRADNKTKKGRALNRRVEITVE